MSEETREERYLRLLSEEEDAFQRASRVADTQQYARRMALSRDWFDAQARVLKEYLHSQVKPSEGGALQPFPTNAVSRAANLAEMLSTGNIHQVIKDVTVNGGAPDRWPGERRDVAVALDYIAHAKAGQIQDRAFIKRVVDAFQVDRTTVRDWLDRQEELTQGFSQMPPEQFPEALHEAGARYHFNRTGEHTEGVD